MVSRVDRFMCAKSFAEEGKIKYHRSNGTMAATYKGRLYLACLNKKDMIQRKLPGVQLVNKHSVESTGGGYTFSLVSGCITWVEVSKKMFEALGGFKKTDESGEFTCL